MPDAVTHWNGVLLDVVRQVGGPPGPISRGAAMMHGAIYDAVNSIVPTHEAYLIQVQAPPTASIEAACAYAAHDTLAAAFPSTTINLAKALKDAVEAIPETVPAAEIAAGKAVGKAAALAMLHERTGDGADVTVPYVPGTLAGDWRPTTAGAGAASPNWPIVKPFCMTTGSQFRPPRPGGYQSKTEMLASAEYAAQLNDVKQLGRIDSATRSAEQTKIAFFWANDADGTYKPPGQLFEITRTVSELKGLDVVENARLFALVAIGMADAGIVAWDAKYSTDLDLWRPVTGVQLADTDGNGSTSSDTTWAPLGTTPAFPAYISGHATFSSAHAGIMRLYFGTDNVTFTATTEDPNPIAHGLTRTFNSFTEAARENARSRVYLGVHYQWDGDHGFVSGQSLAAHVMATRLRPLSAVMPATNGKAHTVPAAYVGTRAS
jgi:hypothetical protein